MEGGEGYLLTCLTSSSVLSTRSGSLARAELFITARNTPTHCHAHSLPRPPPPTCVGEVLDGVGEVQTDASALAHLELQPNEPAGQGPPLLLGGGRGVGGGVDVGQLDPRVDLQLPHQDTHLGLHQPRPNVKGLNVLCHGLVRGQYPQSLPVQTLAMCSACRSKCIEALTWSCAHTHMLQTLLLGRA